MISLSVKSLEGADQITRNAHAQLVGHLLAATQIERSVPTPQSAQKSSQSKDGNADQRDDDDNLGLGAGSSSGAAAGETKKAMLTPQEMFAHLSVHFNKPSASRKTKIGLFDFYAALVGKLGEGFVEANFGLIVGHLVSDIVSPASSRGQYSSNTNSGGGGGSASGAQRYESLLTRTLISVLLRDMIGVRMLSEQAQIGAIQELANGYLKRWPAMMPGQVAPGKDVLVVVLREVAGLVGTLGNAPPPVQVCLCFSRRTRFSYFVFFISSQTALADPLVSLLSHPSHTVRVNAAWALRCFCYSTPLRLPKTILTVMEKLQRDLSSILNPASPPEVSSRALGHAYGLAALVSIIPQRPLYVSYDISAKVLDLSTQLLKRAGEHDMSIAHVEVEVAWTLIASLMSLGPNFVRGHLAQLLVLWRNALPKPTSKDSASNAGRSREEWSFLLHVRECALGAVLCFLETNNGIVDSNGGAGTTLVTLDVARRISSLLSNALSFANGYISAGVDDPLESQLPSSQAHLQLGSAGRRALGLTLRERESLLRRRVHQCFTALGFPSIPDSTQLVLLQSAVSLFASPDGYAGSSVQAAIASSSGTFSTVWASGDGYAYGVTAREGEVLDLGSGEGGVSDAGFGEGEGKRGDYLNRDSVEVAVDTLVSRS